MTTEYKLNTLIEWTDEDRAKGVCPVPAWSVVTLWFEDATCLKISDPRLWDWSGCPNLDDEVITAYLVHSVPRVPIVRWLIVGGTCNDLVYECESDAADIVERSGGRVVKLVEEIE
jgi:hypothetical protein